MRFYPNLLRRDIRDEAIRRRHLANRAWFMYMYVVNRLQGKRILKADFKTLFDNLTVTVGNHVIRMIGFTEFRAGIRTKQVYKLITLCLNTQPIFTKQSAHTS